MPFVYKTNGTYLGFLSNGLLFSRDGEYLGWVEGKFVWDAAGKFRGQVWREKYIITNRFGVQPVPRMPRPAPAPPPLPNPPANLAATELPTGWADAF